MTDATVSVPGKLLEACGRALYGDHWQTPLSRDMRWKYPRTAARWAEAASRDETYQVRASVLRDLLALLERRSYDAPRAFEQLRAYFDQVED